LINAKVNFLLEGNIKYRMQAWKTNRAT